MDKIVKRELSGRCLNEEYIKQDPLESDNLIERLFEHRAVKITAGQLNNKYKGFIAARDGDKGTMPARQSDGTGSSPYNLRPRPLRSLRPPPTSESTDHDSKLVHPREIYDTKTKKWNITSFLPSEADVATLKVRPILDGPAPLKADII